jgi:hypothetical protein
VCAQGRRILRRRVLALAVAALGLASACANSIPAANPKATSRTVGLRCPLSAAQVRSKFGSGLTGPTDISSSTNGLKGCAFIRNNPFSFEVSVTYASQSARKWFTTLGSESGCPSRHLSGIGSDAYQRACGSPGTSTTATVGVLTDDGQGFIQIISGWTADASKDAPQASVALQKVLDLANEAAGS